MMHGPINIRYRVILSLEAPNYVSQLTDDELSTGYYQQDGATCHTSNVNMREIESFFKTELTQKTFGHPDLPI